MDIHQIDRGTESEMDALERSWFAASRAAEAARAELQTAEASQAAPGTLADVRARIDNAEHQKHEIMLQINALEDSLID